MPVGNKNTRGIAGICGSDDGAEVVRIFNTIEYNYKRLASLEQGIEVCVRECGRDRDDALMNRAIGQPVQHGAFFFSNRNVALARELKDFFQLTGMRFPRNVDTLDRHAA
jgi:hypothetical protein